jgi:anaerobic selenocysteine-containing dehydrogenase
MRNEREMSGQHAVQGPLFGFLPKAGTKEAKTGETWVYGYCMGYTQADCSTRNFLKDGVLINMEGNPDCPTNQGEVCPRAIAGIMGLYNPYRVKVPLKRTNPEKEPDIDPR